MNFSHFFIRRPIFAGVLSILIFVMGLIAMWKLPISEYPEVVPPTVVVQATYPGANPKTIAETVAAPLEQAINGVENSLYMFSQSTPDGVMALTITFRLGTDVDKAQVLVQNRVSQALPKLPEEVRRLGVTTTKQSPDLTMVVHLTSPNGRYDEIYLRNYATLQVKDELARIPGAGSVMLFGSGDYAMRVWLNPDKIAARNLTASDVVNAIREQNVQIAAGAVGQPPVQNGGVNFELQINAKGRLLTEEEFNNIIVRTGPNGEKTLLKDVARLELGASGYSLRSLLNNKRAVAIPIFQLPGANALQLSTDVRAKMEELKKDFPEGIDYSVVYDPTVFVRHSISAVVKTLFEAILLVVVVVILFLQTWRASIIPLAAVPVSLVGTFAVMLALGFSINMLTLFGLVLAIGIVVDDAIVVVENVERNIALGLSPFEATKKAMSEVTGPIIAIALVLCAVFIPTAFISGLTGQFYKQFAITIAISTVISAINSLTLSPALCAVLLKGHNEKKDIVSRVMETLFGWIFRPFNRAFTWSGNKYAGAVGGVLRKSVIALLLYGGLVFLTGWSFTKVPTGFVPQQDKQYLVAFAQLPDAASLDRTEAVLRRMAEIGLKTPGVQDAVQFPGLSISGFSVAPNAGIIFFGLKPFEERNKPELSGPAIAQALNAQFAGIEEAFVLSVMPPPVMGLGTIGGFKLFIEDRAGLGHDELFKQTQALLGQSYQTPQLAGAFSTFTVNVPQLDAGIDRVKAKAQGVPLQNLFETMQIYLGSLYVNDFNLFGRTYQVVAQADAPYRDRADDITKLKTRNAAGQMVPLGTLVKVKESNGPDRAMRYNGYPAAEINGGPAPGFSSGQGEAAMQKIAQNLPKGMAFEWTDLTYQRILAGNTAVYVYPLCILLVFLVLAAQYESFRLPLAIILVVPLCLLFAIAGVWLKGGDNNIFTQIGFIVLIGLACKNAILIVEFAKHKQDEEGLSPVQAAIEACRLRLRPILMTSIAFIAGVFPLVVSHGAGAEMRQAMGVAVFAGMIGVTLFGLFLTPVFYVVLMKLGWRRKPEEASREKHGPASGAAGAVAGTAAVLMLTTMFSQSASASTSSSHLAGARSDSNSRTVTIFTPENSFNVSKSLSPVTRYSHAAPTAAASTLRSSGSRQTSEEIAASAENVMCARANTVSLSELRALNPKVSSRCSRISSQMNSEPWMACALRARRQTLRQAPSVVSTDSQTLLSKRTRTRKSEDVLFGQTPCAGHFVKGSQHCVEFGLVGEQPIDDLGLLVVGQRPNLFNDLCGTHREIFLSESRRTNTGKVEDFLFGVLGRVFHQVVDAPPIDRRVGLQPFKNMLAFLGRESLQLFDDFGRIHGRNLARRANERKPAFRMEVA